MFVVGTITYFVGVYYESIAAAPNFVLLATIGALLAIAAAIFGVIIAILN
jgi:hypothetical protein